MHAANSRRFSPTKSSSRPRHCARSAPQLLLLLLLAAAAALAPLAAAQPAPGGAPSNATVPAVLLPPSPITAATDGAPEPGSQPGGTSARVGSSGSSTRAAGVQTGLDPGQQKTSAAVRAEQQAQDAARNSSGGGGAPASAAAAAGGEDGDEFGPAVTGMQNANTPETVGACLGAVASMACVRVFVLQRAEWCAPAVRGARSSMRAQQVTWSAVCAASISRPQQRQARSEWVRPLCAAPRAA
jgi:hypothetical protein